jgi:hypothetical protein
MRTTTDVVRLNSFRETYRRRGYFFREAAMLTIFVGFCLHPNRVIFGDQLAIQYVVTTTVDKALLLPMTYAAVTGILSYQAMKFTSRRHQIFITGALAYIPVSVPLHVFCSYVLGDVSLFVTYSPMWFSYFLLCLVYPVFLTMLFRLHYRN